MVGKILGHFLRKPTEELNKECRFKWKHAIQLIGSFTFYSLPKDICIEKTLSRQVYVKAVKYNQQVRTHWIYEKLVYIYPYKYEAGLLYLATYFMILKRPDWLQPYCSVITAELKFVWCMCLKMKALITRQSNGWMKGWFNKCKAHKFNHLICLEEVLIKGKCSSWFVCIRHLTHWEKSVAKHKVSLWIPH